MENIMENGEKMHNDYIYIKIGQKVPVKNKKVMLKDIAKIYSNNSALEKQAGDMVILTVKEDNEHCYSFSIMKIIDMITKKNNGAEVINIGETDFIVEYQPPEKRKKTLEYLKAVIVTLVIFFGAAFTIMTFNTDVNVGKQFNKVYKLTTGVEKNKTKVLEISYSIGIGIGIMVFFNHFSNKKIHDDPTPIEIELCTYEKDICDAIIKNSEREGKVKDI